ncbi:MAG TPA: hypothetical protein VMF88_12510 [Bacteroidota bacterium]|nr:hypothetical protein [Bacteroidota bacterium]
MKKNLFIILLCFASSEIFAQSSGNAFTILLGGAVGKFNIDAGGNFNTIYTDRKLSYTAVAGLGTGSLFVIGKYRTFEASGQSLVSNIAATGSAQWKQTILLTGLRFGPGNSAFYLDALYVFNHAQETIGTVNPAIDVLAASQKVDDNGYAFAVGLSPKIADPLAINFEAEYSVMARKATLADGNTVPNLGGLYLSAGISFYFHN